MVIYKVITYTTATGKAPFNEWIQKLDKVSRARIRARIVRVTLGSFGDCKTLSGCPGLYELRIDQGPGYRVYFGKRGMTIIILLCAGDKKTQRKDIEKAIIYWKTIKESV